jgi:hypothetical protein
MELQPLLAGSYATLSLLTSRAEQAVLSPRLVRRPPQCQRLLHSWRYSKQS